MCCVAQHTGAFDDITKIGQEDASWFMLHSGDKLGDRRDVFRCPLICLPSLRTERAKMGHPSAGWCRRLENNINSNGGGRECPPHTCTLRGRGKLHRSFALLRMTAKGVRRNLVCLAQADKQVSRLRRIIRTRGRSAALEMTVGSG
jgi:hypothetical protein